MVQEFTIYVMQTSHTDIGYTHPQETIERMYLDFYDSVLERCRQSEHEAEEQRFKWTCETFWQVQHYVQSRPEREEEFLYFVRKGQIEVTAAYLHFTDMIDSDAYRRSIKLAVDYCRAKAIPLKTAIHSDINGWPWSTADILAELEIPYFCSHVHIDSAADPLGKPGSVHYMWKQIFPKNYIKEEAPIRVPQMFWWQGPAEKQVLHWFGEHYNLGNTLGLSGIKSFGTDKSSYYTEMDTMSVEEIYEVTQRELPRYVEQLREAGYPYDRLLINTAGFFVDNSPPDGRWCEIIARWNREHTGIHLRTATVGEWFEDFQQYYPETSKAYPRYQVAWPDYWAHGLGSETRHIAMERRTQRRREDVLALVEESGSEDAHKLAEQALHQELLALEHTFGAWSTSGRPASPLNEFQQMYKDLTFHRADLYFNEAASKALRAVYPRSSQEPQLHIGSVSGGKGMHTVHFSVEDIQIDPQQQVLTDASGREYPFQVEDGSVARYVTTLPLVHAEERASFSLKKGSGQVSNQPWEEGETLKLESEAWSLQIDAKSGHMLSMRERGTQREWVDAKHEYGFGQLVHEKNIHPLGRKAASNEARMIALGIAGDGLLERWQEGEVFQRSSYQEIVSRSIVRGPVFDEVRLQAGASPLGAVQVAWRVYTRLPIVELVISWDKPWSELPEAGYVAFPFAVQNGDLQLESGGGFFRPGSNEVGGQLAGTCPTYYTIQRAAQVRAENGAELLWLPLDAPLVMPNAINFNQWEKETWDWNGFLASMPVNHYWHTNFPTSQRGQLRLRYRFISQQGFASREEALRLAQPVEALGWR